MLSYFPWNNSEWRNWSLNPILPADECCYSLSSLTVASLFKAAVNNK